MELIKKIFIFSLLIFTLISCEKNEEELISTTFYYPIEDYTINKNTLNIPEFNPNSMVVSENLLYICNTNRLEVFDLLTKRKIRTITSFKKNNIETPLTALTSIAIHNGRIYIGSEESRLFIIDQNTYDGINILGNGQWWQTFVHVFGVAVSDEYIFVKEKNATIKVYKTVDVTSESTWNPQPIAKLTTKTGFTEHYSLAINDGNLIVAGNNTKSFLYYNINSITASAQRSLENPIEPRQQIFENAKPSAISFNLEWAITGENQGTNNYLRIYPRNTFMFLNYNPIVTLYNIGNAPNFGRIASTASFEDSVLLLDSTNKNIKVLKIKKSQISEQ